MTVEVKFCGMTRAIDVREAANLGAAYVGVIFTRSPRQLTVEQAGEVLAPLDGSLVRRVGVFGEEPVSAIVATARALGLQVLQLHGRRSAADLTALRTSLPVQLWRAIRVGPAGLRSEDRRLFEEGDGTLLDTMKEGALGGTGTPFDWAMVAGEVTSLRAGRPLILAGGLRPENVRDAIDRVNPDVVDVSSGVELAPGLKDHRRMADFMALATRNPSNKHA